MGHTVRRSKINKGTNADFFGLSIFSLLSFSPSGSRSSGLKHLLLRERRVKT
jgi:hypothetical protein